MAKGKKSYQNLLLIVFVNIDPYPVKLPLNSRTSFSSSQQWSDIAMQILCFKRGQTSEVISSISFFPLPAGPDHIKATKDSWDPKTLRYLSTFGFHAGTLTAC